MSTAPGNESGPPKDVRIYHGYFPESGMTALHFFAFQRLAADQLPGYERGGSPLTIAVRCSNLKSLPWIKKDFPAKSVFLKIKTSKATGLVTCQDDEHGKREKQVQAAIKAGYLVVGLDLVARNLDPAADPKQPCTQVTGYGDRDYQPQPYEVVDPDAQLPIVSDYDLLGVWPPENQTAILGVVRDRGLEQDGTMRASLSSFQGSEVTDIVSPWADRVAKSANGFLAEHGKRPRVMHGAHENFDDFPEGATLVFLPSQEIIYLATRDAAKAFYAARGRHTAKQPYEPGAPNPLDTRPNAAVYDIFTGGRLE